MEILHDHDVDQSESQVTTAGRTIGEARIQTRQIPKISGPRPQASGLFKFRRIAAGEKHLFGFLRRPVQNHRSICYGHPMLSKRNNRKFPMMVYKELEDGSGLCGR